MKTKASLHALVRTAMPFMGAAVILVAGLAKISDVHAFAEVLKSWTIIPSGARYGISLAVPLMEIAIGGACLLGLWRESMRLVAIVFMVFVTSAYALESAISQPPSCGCFGKLLGWAASHEGVWLVVGRNVAVIGLLAAPWLLATSKRVFGAGATGRTSRPATSRGFTLIETIVVLVLVALLVSLLMPSLSKLRAFGSSARALSDLRSHAQIASVYSSDFRGMFPCIADPAYTTTILTIPDDKVAVEYFDQRLFWYFGLAPGYYGGNYRSSSFFAPSQSGYVPGHAYDYSISLVARPEFWNSTTRMEFGQFAATRVDEVLYPSAKSIYLNLWESYWGRANFSDRNAKGFPVESSFCDGSASAVMVEQFTSPMPSGEGPLSSPYARVHLGLIGVHTINGVRGRDVSR